ncbi:MAG: CDP-glucose 4,6-dehydratase [Verrucomicrobiaceae bacterium]|nr:MAG: CDP-glucose 4,6-dehydratase [Verrucomicrobiaceae bacterium]
MYSSLETAYRGRRVLVTGHTGFKGSWLCEWLLSLGAEVAGYALDPQPHELLYSQLDLEKRISGDNRGNLSDRAALLSLVSRFKPEIILHLAAQPLVRLSYEIPVETFTTNIIGTANVLEAVRVSGIGCAVVAVTTDKCYENREWLHAYREEDSMGGHDPYSASKGAAELVISSYRRSFFPSSGNVRVASARAGNVIGGGDWAVDRIVPDCFRALRCGQPIPVRSKIATRPWQHVLEPLSGYLWLAACLLQPLRPVGDLTSGFNFGPCLASNRTVSELVAEIIKHTGGKWVDASDPQAVHEAAKLNLATDKAFHLLEWRPVWSFPETIEKTVAWYQEESSGTNPADLTRSQIAAYQSDAAHKHLPWASPL